MTDTLHFVAENFEAVATRVPAAQDENVSKESLWIVTAPPGLSYSVKVQHHPDVNSCSTWLLSATRGWQFLGSAELERSDAALALAISLVYSVPGVRLRDCRMARWGRE